MGAQRPVLGFIEPTRTGGGGVHGGARAAKASSLQIYKNVTDDTIDFTQLFVYICVAFKILIFSMD